MKNIKIKDNILNINYILKLVILITIIYFIAKFM